MGASRGTEEQREVCPVNAVSRRDTRWNRAIGVSMAAAAFVHASLFLLWPSWQPVSLRSEPRQEMIQIHPISSYGAFSDEGDSRMPAAPSPEPVELALDLGDDAGEAEETGDWAEAFNFPEPSLSETETIVPRATELIRDRAIPALILEQMADTRPEVVMNSNVSWPVIRNPTVLTRYLRTRYNPHFQGGSAGYVSVMMWIDERGSVDYAQVSESSGISVLDEIALDAFSEIVAFAPARERGAPVPIAVIISVPFNTPW